MSPTHDAKHREGCGCGHEHDHHDGDCNCGHDHDHHDDDCGCGHDHDHHDDDCGCGHDHKHHGHGCDCGHDHAPRALRPMGTLSVLQQNMLLGLYERRYLPVACFAMTRAGEDAVYAVALAPVYLTGPADSLEDVKALGQSLRELEEADLITLDYDQPLRGYAYDEYKRAAVYELFVRTVAEGSAQPDALFDTPLLELGSMALTERGVKTVEEMMG